MKENLENKLIEFMDRALNGIDASVDFMSAQLPDYIEQLLMWHIISNVGFLIVFPVLAVISIRHLIKTYKNKDSWAYDSIGVSIEFVFLSVIFGTASAFILVMSYNSIMDVVKILITPKVWLIEYVSKLAN